MRLINAEKLRAEAIESCKFCHLNGGKYCREKCEINALTKLIDNAPTVGYPQGEWYYNYQNGWHCSICHESVKDMPTVMGKADFNFCPNCGADMRGKKHE